jgi:hypothetical protein
MLYDRRKSLAFEVGMGNQLFLAFEVETEFQALFAFEVETQEIFASAVETQGTFVFVEGTRLLLVFEVGMETHSEDLRTSSFGHETHLHSTSSICCLY